MHHRTADTRLLSNLLQHEKEYTKQLLILLDTSNASLTSLAAYAAASPQPLSPVIMTVAGSLAAADDALRRYAHSIELWRDTMARLKDMEDEVGNIIRDREILVTRLIKASKSSKPGSSIIGSSVRSSSSLSLSNNQDSPSSRSLSLTFSTSSKLSAAQSELQACELHLATKERELATCRSTALREGLGTRLKALIDCGWAWGELGKEGLRSLEALQFDSSAGDGGQNSKSTDADSFFVKASSESGISSLSPSQSASQTNHDHHDVRPPTFHSFRSSELLSAPALAAEFSTTTIRPISMATTTTNGTLSGSGTSTPAHAALLAATTSTLTYAPAVAVHIPPSSTTSAVGVATGIHETETMGRSEIHLPFPPPHALGGEYVNIPLAEMVDAIDVGLGEVEGNRSPPSRSSFSDKLDEQNKELDEHRRVVDVQGEPTHEVTPQMVERQVDKPVREQKAPADCENKGSTGEGHSQKAIQDPESSSDEAQKLEVVENPRFMYEKQREPEEKNERLANERNRVPFGSLHLPQTQSGRATASDKNPKTSSSSPSKTFLGSLRGFFGSKDKSPSVSHPKAKLRAPTADSSDSDSSSTNDDDWRVPTAKKRKKVLKTLLFRPQDKKTVSTGAKLELGRGGFDSWNGNPSGSGSGLTGLGKRRAVGKLRAEESSKPANGDSEGWAGPMVTSVGRMKAGSVDRLELGGTGKQANYKGRTRASSDVGIAATGSHGHSPQSQRLKSTRRLKKNRTAADGSGVERSGSIGSDLDIQPSGGKLTKTAIGGPPIAVSATIAKATWAKDYAAGVTALSDQNKGVPHIEKQGGSKRNNSADLGVANQKKQRRESYILIDHPDSDVHGDGVETLGSPTPSSSKGQIIDLGESRAREEERGREEITQQRGKDEESARNSAARSDVKETGMAVARSSSSSSPKKATTVLAVHSNEEESAMPLVRGLSGNPSFGTKGGSDIGKTRRIDSLGQSSFSVAGTRNSASSPRPATSSLPVSVSIPKSTPETGPSQTSKTTAATAPATMSLMSIVEDVKRIREAGQITTLASAKSGPMETVRDPPRTSKEGPEHLAGRRGAGRAGGQEDKSTGSVLFQAQAPGSVFDQKHQTSTGPNSSSTSSPNTSALGVGVKQRQGHGQVIKTPLKSALKNTSRTPSPSPLVRSAALPVVASVSAMSNGITHLGPPLSITGQGLVDAENESTYESGEEEFFTDEGELNGENGHARVEDNPTTAIYTVLPMASDQTPRKRKSVRVSLKPTFSPSPPAIEYGDEETYGRSPPSHHYQKSDTSRPYVPAKHKQNLSHGEGNPNDNWEDSSDEDEEYKNAKAALSRAARKDKEVSQSVFGR